MSPKGTLPLFTLLSLLGICANAAAQSPGSAEPKFKTSVQVTAIEITVKVTDDSGKTPGDLKAEDFTVLEDGKSRPVIGVEQLSSSVVPAIDSKSGPPVAPQLKLPSQWEIVIYFDQTLSSINSIRTAAKKLHEQVSQLVGSGSVEVVSSDPSPRTILPPTRDLSAIGAALQAIEEHPRGRSEIERLRRSYLAEIDQNADDQTLQSSGGASNKELDIQHEMIVRRAVAEEYQVITRQRDKLTRWVSDRPKRDEPRVLLLVGDGFDLDPREFYLNGFKLDSSLAQMRNELQSFDSSKDTESLAKMLSAAGWTSVTVSPGYLAAGFATDASVSGASRVDSFLKGSSNQNAEPVTLFSHPLDPMRMYAEATGGMVLTDPNKLAGFSDELGKRVRITYQVSRFTTGEVHRIQVKSNRAGLHVDAPQWSGQVASEDISSSRARSLIAGDAMKGDLPVRCEAVPTNSGSSSKKKSTTLRAVVDFSPLASLRDELRATTVRVSVGVDIPSALPTVTHQLSKNVDLSAQSTFVYEAPVNYRQGSRTASIVVEETATGAWGGCTTSLDGQPNLSPAELAQSADAETDVAPSVTAREKSWAEAFAKAREEGKLVFVSYPLGASSTTTELLEMRAKTLADAAVQRRLTMFVYIDDPGGATNEAAARRATFAVFDPRQTPIATWYDMVNAGGMVARLDSILRGASEFVNSANLLEAGRKAESDLARGIAYNRAGRPPEARVVLAQGRALADEDKNAVLVQRIDLQVAWSWALQGDVRQAREILDGIKRAPANREIDAAASFAIGSVRLQAKDVREARDAFREVARLASRDSDLFRMAVQGYRNAGGMDDLVPSAESADSNAITIVPPSRALVSGRTTFRTLVSNPEVKRVEFFLDGKSVADRTEPPFETRIDLGSTPRLQSIEVVAYRGDGSRIGGDRIDLNSRPGDFSVHILSPDSGAVSGAVPFEATTVEPSGHHVVRLEIFWNESLIARMERPPFRKLLNLSELGAGGYLRAVAQLDDGRIAEDVRSLNVAGVSENLEVRLVELFLSIDAAPEVLASLTKLDFEITEDGVPQHAESFAPAASIPLTLGVALDSSASMKGELATAQEAAARFLEDSVSDGDQAFFIDFDSQPRLLQNTTGNVQLLTKSILQTEAGGGTALYDTIMFGLLQLQGSGGRRALVVLTDGHDESSTYGLKSVERMAARTDIPIYLLLLGDRGAVPTGVIVTNKGFAIGEGDSDRRKLQTLVSESGGRIFGIGNVRDVPKIYAAIRAELGSQHLLTYRSSSSKPESEWRKVEVKSLKRDVKVRTISGYYPRD